MNAPSVDIAGMMAADSSLALTIGTDLFIGKEPVDPRNCVTIFDMGSYPTGLTLMGQGENYYYPRVRILCRNRDYRTAYDTLQDIEIFLHGKHKEVVGDVTYTLIKSMGSPALLDWDDGGYCRFQCYFEVQRR